MALISLKEVPINQGCFLPTRTLVLMLRANGQLVRVWVDDLTRFQRDLAAPKAPEYTAYRVPHFLHGWNPTEVEAGKTPPAWQHQLGCGESSRKPLGQIVTS